MNKGLSKSLGMVLLAAAVFAAAGCTAPGSSNATPASSAAASSSESPTSGPLGPSSEPTGAADAAAPTNPATDPATNPAADPAAPPADGQAPGLQAAPAPTFAPPEQQYLSPRVPQGTDPNAVLQVGQEQCAQLVAVKAADQKAVVSQLIETKDADVADAVANLCPELKPELDAAGRGFTDGEFTIGEAAPKDGQGSIASGSYEAWNPSATCQLTAFDAAGGKLAESNGTSPITIPAGTARVVSDGCYTWLAA